MNKFALAAIALVVLVAVFFLGKGCTSAPVRVALRDTVYLDTAHGVSYPVHTYDSIGPAGATGEHVAPTNATFSLVVTTPGLPPVVFPSFRFAGGHRFDSGDSVWASVFYPGGEWAFGLHLHPHFVDTVVIHDGILPAFAARSYATISVGTDGVAAGLGYEVGFLQKLKLFSELLFNVVQKVLFKIGLTYYL